MLKIMNITFRQNTWDSEIWRAVYELNEYRVNRFSGKVVVDIGAHIGSFSRLANDNGASAVYAFEPDPENYEVLCKNVEGTIISAYNLAVYSVSGMCVKSDSSYIPANTGGCNMILSHNGARTISMDDIIDLAGYIHILKMDCEGGEYPGLLKCTKLDRVDSIVGEYHRHLTGTIEDLKNHLNENGFSVGTEPTENGLGHFLAVRL